MGVGLVSDETVAEVIPTEEWKTQFFIDLYMYALRIAANNIFLKAPKEGSKRWIALNTARQLVDEMGGDYDDFIRLQFTIFKRLGFPPKPEQLITQNAINRYKIHQKLKNRVHYKEYSVDGDYFIVHKTNRRYPLSQVNLPSTSDPDANFAFALSEGEGIRHLSEKEQSEAKASVIYAVQKLCYKGRHIPERLLKLYEEVQNE